MKRWFLLLSLSALSLASLAVAQNEDYYEVQSHGPEKWVTFFSPLNVQYKFTTPGIIEYSLVFNPDFQIRDGKDPLFVFKFEETGKFNPALRPQLPVNSHLQFIIDGKPTAEMSVRQLSFRNENDIRHVIKFYAVGNRQIIENMIAARTVRGLLYYRQVSGSDVQKSNVKSFTLDPKILRSLGRLLSATR
ncbi:MAG: hypothetical protein PHP42_03185 [Bacteroidota bacterium]|nr:hypothetical protein [Bacteroidota bacterium]